MIGETLRKIRKNRNLTQKELAEGIVQQATYSRIESGQLAVSATILYKLVERLNISMNEFFYIAQGYEATSKQRLIQNFARMELTVLDEVKQQLSATHQYLTLHNDTDVLMLHYAYQSMEALVQTQNLEKVRSFAELVWQRIQTFDHWYLNDLELINAIILYFPLDVAREMTQTAIRRLDAYDQYERDTMYLKLYFRLNLTSLYLAEGNFTQCLTELQLIHEQFQKHLPYQTLGFLLVRKMTCKHFLPLDYSEEQQAFAMLAKLFPDDEVYRHFKQEMVINKVTYI